MKFCKRYRECMQGREKELPAVDLKKLKKMLRRCRTRKNAQSLGAHLEFEGESVEDGDVVATRALGRSDPCPVCEDMFFPLLLKEMTNIVGCFNERAQKLLALHLASGFRKYLFWAKGKLRYDPDSLIQQGYDLVNYAIINSIAVRKILKKYDKVHISKQGQVFQSQVQSMHIETLQSPWFCELMAFCINKQRHDHNPGAIPGLFEGCSLTFDDGKPALSCGLFDSLKLNIDLTCAICLDTVFDIVSLSCGHIFCYMCACGAASVSIVDGLKSANPKSKCPLCRQAGVYEHTVRLNELNILLSGSCNEYWKERLQRERIERVQKAKEHWQSQCQAFMGF